MKLEFSPKLFEKRSNIKPCENLSSEIRVVPCGRTEGQTDMTKVTFRWDTPFVLTGSQVSINVVKHNY